MDTFLISLIGLGIHFLLVVYFLRTLHGQHIILSIPLAGAGSGSIETVLLGTIYTSVCVLKRALTKECNVSNAGATAHVA